MNLQERIRLHYRRGISYHQLMWAVFPPSEYPRAYRNSHNGGPPGVAMPFGAAIRRMGGYRTSDNLIFLPINSNPPPTT